MLAVRGEPLWFAVPGGTLLALRRITCARQAIALPAEHFCPSFIAFL